MAASPIQTFLRGRKWHIYGERSAMARVGFELDMTALLMDNLLANGEAEARTMGLAGEDFSDLEEAFKKLFLIFVRNPRTGVLDFKLERMRSLHEDHPKKT